MKNIQEDTNKIKSYKNKSLLEVEYWQEREEQERDNYENAQFNNSLDSQAESYRGSDY